MFVALLAGALLPRVESPVPESIGLSLPFVLAGAGGVLAGVFVPARPAKRRDRWIIRAGRIGFGLGLGFYLLSLAIQLGLVNMQRFVLDDWRTVVVMTLVLWVLVGVTGTGETGAILIGTGLIAIALRRDLALEKALEKEERAGARGRSGAGRSTGSR
ncbi:MAG TPA: hypothetical protein VF081_05650 [Solirubrobacterales bacterium]